MTLYKLFGNIVDGLISISRSDGCSVPSVPANTDYQQFKQAINDDTAQLQDADGNLMTSDEAKAFVATLP